MKIIIAPARNMKADPDSLPIQGLPQFLPQTETILDYLRSLSYDQLHHLWWDCSEKIAIPNYQWVQQMDLYHQLTRHCWHLPACSTSGWLREFLMRKHLATFKTTCASYRAFMAY